MSTTSTVFAFNLVPNTGTPDGSPDGDYDATNQVWVGATEVAQTEACAKRSFIWENARYCHPSSWNGYSEFVRETCKVCYAQGYTGCANLYCPGCRTFSSGCPPFYRWNTFVKVRCYCRNS
jgi:hypothetical protein